jgi:hypothetical protein
MKKNSGNRRLRVVIDVYMDDERQLDAIDMGLRVTAAAIVAASGADVQFDSEVQDRKPIVKSATPKPTSNTAN